MGRALGLTLLPVTLTAASAGCAGFGQQAQPQTPPPPQQEMRPVEPEPDIIPAKFVKGRVFRVWQWGNGELMAYLGTKDGVKKGDILVLQRAGLVINTIEVLVVSEDQFLGRVYERGTEALMPQVGDTAILGPIWEMPKPETEPPKKP